MTESGALPSPRRSPGLPRTAMERLLAPESIAVVGTSVGPGRGTRAHTSLQRSRFPGRLYAVNPKYTEVLGTRCYPSLDGLPEIVDCAVIAVPADPALRVVEQCATLGIPSAIVFASGFAEAEGRGRERQDALARLAGAGGVAVCGPNCVGLINVRTSTAPFTPLLPSFPRPGNVALVGQSGGLLLEVLSPLIERGVGFSHVIPSGNEAVTTLEDYLAHLIEQPEVEVLALIVESFKRPKAFLHVADRAAALDKPIIALKTGRSAAGRRAAQSHTGSLAEDDRVIDAAFRRTGVLRVRTTEQFIETVALFWRRRWPTSRGVAVVSSSGGRCTLLGDLAGDVGLELAEFAPHTRERLQRLIPEFGSINNPLDPTGIVFDQDGIYGPVLSAVADDPAVGSVAVYQLTRNVNAARAEARPYRSVALARELAGAARATSKPVMTFTTVAGGSPDPQVLEVLDEAGIPLLRGIENALWALRSAIEYADRRARPLAADGEMVRVADPAAAAAARERLTRDGTLSEAWSKRLIAAYGVPVPDGGVATTVVDALRIAAEIGYPVVAKATSPDLTHKTDLGLVRLSITDAGGLRAAFTDVQERADAHVRAAGLRPLEGILIERMTPAGVEVVVGARRSEFGPIAVFGAGGVLTELVADTSVRLAPLGRDEAAAMVSETRIGRLLHGYRGGPTYDVDALARLLRQVAALLGDFEDVVDAVDVNPVLMTPGGPVAVDAVVFGRARGAPPL